MQTTRQHGIVRMIHNEKWLDGVGAYYVHHNIGNRLFVTFEEFANMVESGQWERFIQSGQGIPDVAEGFTKYNQTYKLVMTDGGYSIHCDKNGNISHKVFGITLADRDAAMKMFEDIKKQVIGEFVCT